MQHHRKHFYVFRTLAHGEKICYLNTIVVLEVWRTYKTSFKIRQMKDKVRCSKFECQKAFWDSTRTVCKKHNFKACDWELNLRGRRSRGFNSRRPWSCIFRKWSRLRLKMYIFLTLQFITPYCVTFIYWQRV